MTENIRRDLINMKTAGERPSIPATSKQELLGKKQNTEIYVGEIFFLLIFKQIKTES